MAFGFPNVTGNVTGNPAQVNLYTTRDFRATGKQCFEENRSCNLNGEKTILT